MRRKRMVYQLISSLLQYPEEEWQDLDETWKKVSRITEDSVRIPLIKFLTYLKEIAYEELSDNYFFTFEFNGKTTLYLTKGVTEDTHERRKNLGQLRQELDKGRIELTPEDQTDYLPLILRFNSEDQVEQTLRLYKRSIDILQLELQEINSPYRFLITACMENMVQSDEDENEKVS